MRTVWASVSLSRRCHCTYLSFSEGLTHSNNQRIFWEQPFVKSARYSCPSVNIGICSIQFHHQFSLTSWKINFHRFFCVCVCDLPKVITILSWLKMEACSPSQIPLLTVQLYRKRGRQPGTGLQTGSSCRQLYSTPSKYSSSACPQKTWDTLSLCNFPKCCSPFGSWIAPVLSLGILYKCRGEEIISSLTLSSSVLDA